ncbi:hypothetical protein HMPREF1410_00257 [Helicobacter pylori GAM249T]|nr:hypothetical protein HMPREF1410_00257 [Helicobacter pylori GAM249T]
MFPSINKEKIKPLNLDKLSNYAYKTRLFHQKDYSQERRDKTNIIYEFMKICIEICLQITGMKLY